MQIGPARTQGSQNTENRPTPKTQLDHFRVFIQRSSRKELHIGVHLSTIHNSTDRDVALSYFRTTLACHHVPQHYDNGQKSLKF
ncbi:hypothetical protein STEG23_022256 [Scotinomys teguina]